MSENTKKTVCPECGKEVDVNEKKDFKKILNAIRGVLEDEQVDDIEAVEEEQLAEEALSTSTEATVSEAKPSLRGRFKLIFGNRLINRLVVFLIAVAMLVMAFMPMVTYQVKTADEAIYTVNYSGVDNVQVSLFSLLVGKSAGAPDLSEYEAAFAEITDPAARVALIRQMTIASSVYSQRGLYTTTLLASLLFALYVLLCTILVIVSAVNLFTEFFTGKKTRDRVKKFASDGFLCFLICLLPALFFLMLQACEICTGVGVLGFVTPIVGANLSWAAIVTIVLAVLGGILVCASHSLGLLRVDKRYFDRKRIKHLLALVLIVVVMVSTLMPCLQVNAIDVQSGKEIVLGMNFWEIREMTTQEWGSYSDETVRIDKEYLATLGAMPKIPAHSGEVLFNTMFITSNVVTVFVLYAVMEIVTLLTLVFAGLWLFRIIRRSFFGKDRRFMLNLFKILTLLCICLNFIFVLMLKSMLDMNLTGELMYVMQFGIGGGMLVLLLCAFLGVILRLKEKRAIVYADEDYDNAVVCTGYGYTVPKENQAMRRSLGLCSAAKTLMIISTVYMCWIGFCVAFVVGSLIAGLVGALIPLAWCLPMTIVYSKKVKKGRRIGTGFKLCTILFMNLAAGILMFCDNQH